MDLLLKSNFTRQRSLFFSLVPFISLDFHLLVFYSFSNPYSCLSVSVEIPAPSKLACEKAEPVQVQCSAWGGQAQLPAWDSDRCYSGCAGSQSNLSSSTAVADQWKVGLRLQWPPSLIFYLVLPLTAISFGGLGKWLASIAFFERVEAFAVCINIQYFPILKWSQCKKSS